MSTEWRLASIDLPTWTPKHRHDRDVELAVHTRKRAEERFGIEMTHADLLKITKDIQTGKARLLGENNRHTSVYEIQFNDQPAAVYYSKREKCIATILPPEALDHWREVAEKHTSFSVEGVTQENIESFAQHLEDWPSHPFSELFFFNYPQVEDMLRGDAEDGRKTEPIYRISKTLKIHLVPIELPSSVVDGIPSFDTSIVTFGALYSTKRHRFFKVLPDEVTEVFKKFRNI